MGQRKYKRHVLVAVKTVKEFLDLHPANGLSAASLAATAGISRTILHEAFKHEFGVEIGEYKLQARMHHSKKLLLSGCSVKQVAIQLRYASNSTFTSAFKNFFGQTPSEFIENSSM
jgi:AraC-like DNA-binding protein